jgi:predicted NUDIX family phosphoesterase/dephospho-CoA kinase
MGVFLDAAEIVLRRTARPMRTRELTEEAIELGLLDKCHGLTPHQTMKAKLAVNIRTQGQVSRFMRTGKGLFALRGSDATEYTARRHQKVIRATEKVVAFPSKLLEQAGYFHGIKTNYKSYMKVLLHPAHTRHLPRIDAETNLSFKQIVSYVIVRWRDSLLRFSRGNYTSVQSFLAGRYCIGFGGHVQDLDAQSLFSFEDSGYRNCVIRELSEELNLPPQAITEDSLQIVGVLNDDSSELGQMHFAVISLLNLDHLNQDLSAKALKREKSINQLEFVPINRLGEEFPRYEYWSKLCIRKFFPRFAKSECSIHRVRSFSLKRHCRHVAVVGCIGSGKTEVCKLLEQDFGFSYVPTGRILSDLQKTKSIEQIGRGAFQKIALDFIQSASGSTELAEAIQARIRASDQERHVIDGLRLPGTFELLRERLDGDLTLVYVDATVDNAFVFFRQRENPRITMKAFLKLLRHPVENQISDFMKMANLVIYNYGNKNSYLAAIKKFFSEELL